MNSVESDRLLTIQCLEHNIVLLDRLVEVKVQIVVSFYHQVSGVLLTRVFFCLFVFDLFSFFAMTYSISTNMLKHVYAALQELMLLNSCKVLYLYYISYVN